MFFKTKNFFQKIDKKSSKKKLPAPYGAAPISPQGFDAICLSAPLLDDPDSALSLHFTTAQMN